MFTGSRPPRTFSSGAFAFLLLASIVVAQDKPSGATVDGENKRRAKQSL